MRTIFQLWNEMLEANKELKEELEIKIKREIDFEGYLQDIYIESEHPLDDDIPDGFNDWLEQSDIEDIIRYGQQYAEKIYKERNK